MVTFQRNGIRFVLRVAGIAISDNKVLLTKNIKDDYWFIPGGRIEESEDSKAAIIREMKEELDQNIKIVKYLCMIENFFMENDIKYHEVGIYYKIIVPQKWSGTKTITENEQIMEFKWIRIDEFEEIIVYPQNIKNIIKGNNIQMNYIIREYN